MPLLEDDVPVWRELPGADDAEGLPRPRVEREPLHLLEQDGGALAQVGDPLVLGPDGDLIKTEHSRKQSIFGSPTQKVWPVKYS